MIKVAVAGATGIVGTLLANHLVKENLELDLYASEASAGKTINIKGRFHVSFWRRYDSYWI